MSGIEVAGLVLGGVPLLISACEHYVEGLETLHRWCRFEREIKRTKRILIAEQVILQATCERLLEGLVSASTLEHLLDNAESPTWKDQDLDKKLKQRLGKSHGSFISCLVEMEQQLNELSGMLEVNVGDEAGSMLSTSFKKQLQRIKFTFSKRRCHGILKDLEKNNSFLSTFVSQNLELEPLRIRRKKSTTDLATEKHASALYDALNARMNCTCISPHNVFFKLNRNLINEENVGDNWCSREDIPPTHELQSGKPFDLLLSRGQTSNWSCSNMKLGLLKEGPRQDLNDSNTTLDREASRSTVSSHQAPGKERKRDRVRSIFFGKSQKDAPSTGEKASAEDLNKKTIKFAGPGAPAPKTTKSISLEPEIAELCPVIHSLTEMKPETDIFVGFMACTDTLTLNVYAMKSPATPIGHEDFISISSLLEDPQLNRGIRFHLAVVIARSVLQLSATPWLPETIGMSDLLTVASTKSQQTAAIPPRSRIHLHTDTLVQNLYLAKPLPSSTATPSAPRDQFPLLRNTHLFYLGVILIELCLNAPLSSLRNPELDPHDVEGRVNIMTAWATATRLIPSVGREAGNRYADAVRRCIYCEFDQRSTDLANEAFRSAVHQGVISPLEDVWGDFRNG